MSKETKIYHGEFKNENGEIRIEQIENPNDTTTIDIIRNMNRTPHIDEDDNHERIKTEDNDHHNKIIKNNLDSPFSSSMSSISSSEASTSGVSSSNEIKSEDGENKSFDDEEERRKRRNFKKENKRKEIKMDDKIYRSIQKKYDGDLQSQERIKIMYQSFQDNQLINFLKRINSLSCFLSPEDNVNVIKDLNLDLNRELFSLFSNFLYGLNFFNHELPDQFYSMFFLVHKKIMNEDQIPVIMIFKEISTDDHFEKTANDVMSNYLFVVLQFIFYMLIKKKMIMHHISQRYIIKCIFSVVKLMLFPYQGDFKTSFPLFENIKNNEMQQEFIARNVWLRKAWSLLISIIYSHEKKKTYFEDIEREGDDLQHNSFEIGQLLTCYINTVQYYSKIDQKYEKTKKPSVFVLEKIKNEYESNIGIMNFVLYCYFFYNAIMDMGDENEHENYDAHHKITHAAFLWSKYRADLEQCEISKGLKYGIDVLHFKSIFEDSKHLHSFRSTRTFGNALPKRHFKYYDPQDSAAVCKEENRLGIAIMDLCATYGKYESLNSDLSITQDAVENMKILVNSKTQSLRSILKIYINMYHDIEKNGDVPTFEQRYQFFDLSHDDNFEINYDNSLLKWIMIDTDDPKGVMVRINEKQILESNVIHVENFDDKKEVQVKKMVNFDLIKMDIKIAQSVLRFMEQLFNAYYPESKNNI